ncbi:hypothetical protein OCU04_007244 [Sclerotinia nivalis]|uniref:Uncharacterized protein n=1 Tax=Sclerotinia nivalis TaxID=352851 RepID=A0A9X0ALI1_9HELO|nr:hypothetical protein OCU04_007244 [Sclerotinia nivalis]
MLYAAALGRTIEENRQHPLALGNPSSLAEIPGDSIVKLCPESRDTDLLVIESIINRPKPILDE